MEENSYRSKRRRLHLRLGALFRIQAGVAVLLAAFIMVARLPPDVRGRAISPLAFVSLTSVLAWATYATSRCIFSRFTAPLLAVLIAAIAGAAFSRPKIDNPAELAMLGTSVALSWILGAGWLDTRDDAPRQLHNVRALVADIRRRLI